MFSIRRSGFTSAGEITLAIIKDLTENGFSVIAPQSWTPPTETPETLNVTLEAVDADLLNGSEVETKQPWRMRIEVYDAYTVGMSVGSSLSLADSGIDSWDITAGKISGPIGVIGAPYTEVDGTFKKPKTGSADEAFINRKNRVMVGTTDMSTSFPMSYYLATTDHGVFLSVWEDVLAADQAIFSWVGIQRPVDRVSGETFITGKSPVFCVYGIGANIKRFIVRESDVLRPSAAVDATVDSDGYNAIINKEEQVAISESNKYIVNFPSRLNTQRYSYTYELDMFGYTGADVVSENNDIPLEVYGGERVYTTTHSNGPRNTKMRMVALKQLP